MDKQLLTWELRNDYASLPNELFTPTYPSPLNHPKLMLWNTTLAESLNIEYQNSLEDEITNILSGNQILKETQPIAQAYAGHQFGHFNILGDGRAILLGEKEVNNKLYDIQLKGSGPTKYSRRGDGRATLYSMLREYLISEAMHHLGIPSSRSLAIISSITPVYRKTTQNAGILTRIASSHIRVGTFEYAARLESLNPLKELFKYTSKRHYPEILNMENPALELFKTVMDKQIKLVAHWMSVGFIHGVMNTDNTSIAGETFDYGPCAFMNNYHPLTVYSSIDRQGRYAYANQSPIIKWNLTRFAETLLPLMHDKIEIAIDMAHEELNKFDDQFDFIYNNTFLKKIGILDEKDGDKDLLNELLKWMQDHLADFTNTFRGLTDHNLHSDDIYRNDSFKSWKVKWEERTKDIQYRNDIMNQVNPSIIPRNHLVEEVLKEASEDYNLIKFNNFLDKLKQPFESLNDPKYQSPPVSEEGYQTYCGT